jgi:branched-chain amino acid transport system substrate-binding protein
MAKRILPMILLALVIGALFLSSNALAQDKVTMGIVIELSGAGAIVGLRWERGVQMAVEDMNAAGGILGKKVETFSFDTKSEAPVSVAAVRKAIERKPFVIMGPIYSGSTLANMNVARDAGIPQFVGSESPSIGRQKNPNTFVTSINAELAMQKVQYWLTEVLKVKNMALIWANDEFGRAGRDAMKKLLEPKGVKFVADLASEVGQSSFSGELSRIKTSGADTIFIYLYEEESGRLLPQLREMGIDKTMRVVGHTTLLTEDTLRLAKDAANGVVGHVGESPVAMPLKPLADRYLAKFKELPDHNFYKAYIGTMTVRAVVEETKTLDQQKLRDYLHNRTLCVKNHPGILMDLHYDENGDIDRESFLIKIENQKQAMSSILPPLHPEWFTNCNK